MLNGLYYTIICYYLWHGNRRKVACLAVYRITCAGLHNSSLFDFLLLSNLGCPSVESNVLIMCDFAEVCHSALCRWDVPAVKRMPHSTPVLIQCCQTVAYRGGLGVQTPSLRNSEGTPKIVPNSTRL